MKHFIDVSRDKSSGNRSKVPKKLIEQLLK